MVISSALLMVIYIVWRLILPATLPTWLKSVLGLLTLSGISAMVLMRAVLKTETLGSLPLVLGNACQVGVVMLFLLLLGRDLLGLLWRLFSLPKVPFGGSTTVLLLCTCLGTGAGLYAAFKIPDVREVRIAVPGLAPGLDGVRIAHLSDLHIGLLFGADWLQGIVDRVNVQHPDIIVISGDLTDGTPERLARDIAPLAKLRAPYGVFISLGNHDYYASSQWAQTFTRMGFTVLVNRHVTFTVNGTPLVLAGVADPAAARVGAPGPNPTMALAEAPAITRIMLDHRPANANDNAKAGASLQLSGHTHGGLILPLAPVVGSFNKGFISGLYHVDNMPVYVNSGAGLWAGFSARLGVPSEIALITLIPDPVEVQNDLSSER